MSESSNDKKPTSNSSSESVEIKGSTNGDVSWRARLASGVGGGALVTALLIITPWVQTKLANDKEVELARAKASEQQLQYLANRLSDCYADFKDYQNKHK